MMELATQKKIQKKKRLFKTRHRVDITSIPIENDYFDAVMCVEVFEHLPNPIEALLKLNRVLKQR